MQEKHKHVLFEIKWQIRTNIGQYSIIQGYFWRIYGDIRVICSSDRSGTCRARSDSMGAGEGSVNQDQGKSCRVSIYDIAQSGCVDTIRLTPCVLSTISTQ